MLSYTEENYLKTIFHLQKASTAGVPTNALAEHIDAKASSVTDMIKKLSAKGLVDYKKYQGVRLSPIGETSALKVIRRHRLWEFFLVEKLKFSWSEVHEVAEQLEHVQSTKLTEELDRFLGFPKKDPHGDPIPDAEGRMPNLGKILLAEMEEGDYGICSGVRDTARDFLEYLDRLGISLGSEIHILKKESFDNSILISLNDKKIQITQIVANNVYIKPNE